MSNPIVADNKPAKVSLKKGEEYYFCTCGKSANQPFCDGSHKGTSFAPKAVVAEEEGDAYCKFHFILPPVSLPAFHFFESQTSI